MLKIRRNWIRKTISYKRVDEAYVMRDSKYLRKAIKYGSNYLKRLAIRHIQVAPTQKNFNFLLGTLKQMEDQDLKIQIYATIMDYTLNDKIEVSDADSLYLYDQLYLLDLLYAEQETDTESKEVIEKKQLTPITFRNNLRDHLGMLEDKKKQFEIY